MKNTYRVGIDIGGTFTDFALQKNDQLFLHKTLSTPEDRSLGVLLGLEHLAEMEGISLKNFLSQVEAIIHATTVADNTLIEMNGAVTGLLTTAGFRDELELRRGFKEDIWDVRLKPPTPIVPRRRRLGVPERITFDGKIHQELDEAAARKAIARLKLFGAESVAIATLFSFTNPKHELRLGELVREMLPDAHISLSHTVLPKSPEFERVSTTCVNAYVGPRVNQYINRLSERLLENGYQKELFIMQSSGGVMTRSYINDCPIRVLASGPAGGVIGSAHLGLAKAEPNLLCVDMGGTSYDVSVVRNGNAPAHSGWNWHHRYVIALPMIQVETLGAGGGSICQVKGGVLQVGPDSAGSEPGPISYGRGGTLPTVTDAILLLGLLSDESDFAGGSFRLSKEGVSEAFDEQIAGPLGCTTEEAAFDCWRVVNANMTQAVRRVTAEKGIDPKELSMLAYGGNGPVFAGIQAQELGIEKILIPRTSPAFSALGTLTTDLCIDEERSYIVNAMDADVVALSAHWLHLRERSEKYFLQAGYAPSDITTGYKLNLRYPGQNWSLTIDVKTCKSSEDLSFVDAELCQRVVDSFENAHQEEYGHYRIGESPEITGVRLVTTAFTSKPKFGGGFSTAPNQPKPTKYRRANLGNGFSNTPIFSGPELMPGYQIIGPAIIDETFTTIVVYPGWKVVVDDYYDYTMLKIS